MPRLVCCLLLFLTSLAGAQTQRFVRHFAVEAPEVPGAVRREAAGELWTANPPGPVSPLKIFARENEDVTWLGGEQGAVRFDRQATHPWDRWQYFFGRRWLQDNDVRNVFVEMKGASRNVWIRTRTGVSLIEWRPMTLEEKALSFEDRIEARHVRHALVADSILPVPGDVTKSETRDNDNDGLWTAMYLGAQAYRYAVTRSPEARSKAERSARVLMRLEEITGVPGFPARSFVSVREPRPNGGEWHPTADGQWFWKGDTSSDELVGHYYGYALFFDLVANAEEKRAVARVVARLTDHLIRNDYDLIDLDGQPTRWGQWSERYFATEEGRYEAPLRSLELLAFLKTTAHITGDRKYEEAYRDRIRHGYANRVGAYRRWPGGGEINFSDDELAYLSYDPLLRYEKESKLRQVYLEGLRFTSEQIRRDANPLWNYIAAASGAVRMTAALRAESRRTLERIPTDLVTWTVRNSHRLDVAWESGGDRFARRQIQTVLAPDELPAQKWNSNPHVPDGGNDGRSEDDGAFFLLPYWMGRYQGWVK